LFIFVLDVVFGNILICLLQIKAVKTGTILWGTLTALSYFYMVSIACCLSNHYESYYWSTCI